MYVEGVVGERYVFFGGCDDFFESTRIPDDAGVFLASLMASFNQIIRREHN